MTLQQVSSFKGTKVTGSLYLVPTPIGNLTDMTPRAIETLQQVDLIAAEDTRNTQKLLNYFEIKTPQISFHEHNTQERIGQLVTKLKAGQNIAQVSDAGMPSISDPGHELVKACILEDIAVVALPGPNAALTALIASGLAPQPFLFYGFLPRKTKDLKEQLEQLQYQTATMIFYEAPHRLKKTLRILSDSLGENRQIALCRELTKRYEQYLRGSLKEALEWSEDAEIRGEFVLIVQGNSQGFAQLQAHKKESSDLSLKQQVDALIQAGQKPNQAIKQVAKENGLKKQVVYNEYHQIEGV